MSIIETTQSLEPGVMVVIYELDLTELGGSILRFASTVDTLQPIFFGGERYLPIEIEAHGFEWNGQGALPTPTLRISNAEQIASAAAHQYNDLLGATLTRIRTFSQFLDNGIDPDPDARFADDIYKIEQKKRQNKVFIEWELSAALDQEGIMLPGRQVLRDACTHSYRHYNHEKVAFDYSKATCPYSGENCFDEAGLAVAQEYDRCGKKISDCRKRFGQHAELPTRAFPGLTRIKG